MSRRVKTVPVTAEGRDKGKLFVIAEMDAQQAEEWATRAMEAIAQRSDVPAGLQNAGMLGVFILGLKPILAAPFAMVKPLLDEMFASCLSYQPDAAHPEVLRGAGTEDIRPVGPMMRNDIEEVLTRVHLRDQIIELHTGFSPAAVLSQFWGQLKAVAVLSETTPISPAPSASSSQTDSQRSES
jgi:hypothetical protein